MMGWRRISEREGTGIGKSVAEAISDISDQISGSKRAAGGQRARQDPRAEILRTSKRRRSLPTAGRLRMTGWGVGRPGQVKSRSLTRTRRGFG